MTQDLGLATHADSFGLKAISMESFMEPLMIMACDIKPGCDEMKLFPDLLILQLRDLEDNQTIEMIETLRESKLFTIQFVIGPVKITKNALLPAGVDKLPFARPIQSYERFGPLYLSLEEDVSHDQALIVIENDANFCRIDSLQSSDDLLKILDGLSKGEESSRLFSSS